MMKITYGEEEVTFVINTAEGSKTHTISNMNIPQNRLFVFFIMSLLTSESLQDNELFSEVLKHALTQTEVELDYDIDGENLGDFPNGMVQ